MRDQHFVSSGADQETRGTGAVSLLLHFHATRRTITICDRLKGEEETHQLHQLHLPLSASEQPQASIHTRPTPSPHRRPQSKKPAPLLHLPRKMGPRVLYLCPCTLAASAEDRERAAEASAPKDKQGQQQEQQRSGSSGSSATAGPSKGRRSLAPSSASTSTPFQPTDSDPPHQSSSQPNTSTSAQNQDLLLIAVPLPPSLDPSSSYAHHALDSLYFCEECDQLKCARCTSPEVSAYYCPVCLFDVQAAGVKADRNRCVSNPPRGEGRGGDRDRDRDRDRTLTDTDSC